jgi:hypothetical protein
MEAGYIICLMMAVCAVVSVCIYNIVNKSGFEHFARKTILFFISYYFMFSLVKLFLGEPDNTLVESFWDAVSSTYIHYGIILALITVVFPTILSKIIGKNDLKIIGLFDSTSLIGLFLGYSICGEISNATFSIIVVIAFVLMLAIVFGYKKEIQFIPKNEYRKYIFEVLPAVILLPFMSGIYYPCELYLNNVDEFLNSFWQMLLVMAVGSLVWAIVLLIGMLLMPVKWVRPCYLCMLGLGIMGYVQAMFLNGALSDMNGQSQAWSQTKIIVNGIIWLCGIILIVGLGLFQDIFMKVAKGIAVYICLIQLATLMFMVATTDVSGKGNQEALTTNGSLEIAEGNNVFVFVLDMFDSSVMKKIIAEDSDFTEPLSDFVYYENATSGLSHTKISIPYLLTGTEPEVSVSLDDYPQYAYDESTYLQDINGQGYTLGIYTNINYVDDSLYGIVSNYSENASVKCNFGDTYITMRKTAMYNIAPFCLKGTYEYYTADITAMVDLGEVWNIENDFPLYNSLINTGLSINDEYENAFKFYHMRGDHEPFYLSEDLQYDKTGRAITAVAQGKGSLKIVYEYLRQLKDLGKYDDATIIITADHGNIAYYDAENDRPSVPSMPIMLVKEPYQSNPSLVISDAPVSQAEIMPTILENVGVEYDGRGRTFSEISEAEDRTRYYRGIMLDGVEKLFEVSGDASDINNWGVAE